MSAKVIKFGPHYRNHMRPPRASRPPRRRLGSPSMRRALNGVNDAAWDFEACLRTLLAAPMQNTDPRAIAAMVDHYLNFPEWNPANERATCDRALATFTAIIDEYRKRFPPTPPRLVT